MAGYRSMPGKKLHNYVKVIKLLYDIYYEEGLIFK